MWKGCVWPRNLKDQDGIQWAAAGILGQVWPQELTTFGREVISPQKQLCWSLIPRIAKKRPSSSRKLDEAVARDCVVVVSWTGDADIDLFVQEPGGAICSYRNQRTTGGGALVPGVSPQVNKEDIGNSSISYVCPKGFNGTYNVLVRRVWGSVTANKVKVEVFTHFLTEKQNSVSKWLPLKEDKIGVTFQLAEGRRTESLQEQQVANAAIPHLAVQQQLLAQQLASEMDPNAMATAYASAAIRAAAATTRTLSLPSLRRWGRRRLPTGDRHPAGGEQA